MSTYWTPNGADLIAPSELANALARSLYNRIVVGAADFIEFGECRALGDLEIVSFDIAVERPQRPVYDIRDIESVSIVFSRSDAGLFSVLVPRPDFPDTPHQCLMPEGLPCCLCIDDRPWQDVKSSYSGLELLQRLSAWFEKACQGELHSAEQPLDPLFLPQRSHEIILARDVDAAVRDHTKIHVWTRDTEARYLFVARQMPANLVNPDVAFLALHCTIEPQRMARMKQAPRNLLQLFEFLEARGVDLVAMIDATLDDWLGAGQETTTGKRGTLILVTMPLIDPTSGAVGTNNTVAFIATASPGEIGERLGLLARNNTDHGEHAKFVRLWNSTASTGPTATIGIDLALVHPEVDAVRAGFLSGGLGDDRRVVLIGAGAAGSTVAEALVRQGLFRWTIVDYDVLLPHNLVRHTLSAPHISQPKAKALASRINQIRPDADASAIVEDVLNPQNPEELAAALSHSNLVLDLSASVPVSRWASDHECGARRMCAFFTPDGRSAVAMIEAEDRSVTLRDIEAAYLREVLVNDAMENHLGSVNGLRYTGACRAMTSKIPMSAIQSLSGFVSEEIASGVLRPECALRIWTRARGGVIALDVDATRWRSATGDWTINMPLSLRDELMRRRASHLPLETGGPLVGMIDFDTRRVDVVHALSPPGDSVSTTSTFTRGTARLKSDLERVVRRAGSLVRYIGEWHSHPAGHSAAPSYIDLAQIGQLAHVMEVDGLPAISIIVAETETKVLVGETMRQADG